ncbi:MAG: MBL fold metallo-hydrolase [Oligoflexia bacterium]
MQNLVYLVIDWSTKKAAWVDPQKDLSQPMAFLEDHGLELQCVLLTHTHHDHVAGLPALLSRFKQLEVLLHPADAFRLKLEPNFKMLQDGDCFKVGSLELRAWNMPGHSAGALTFEILRGPASPRTLLLTGDTLFIRDCGRTDLPTGSTEQMFASLQRYRQFDDESVIFPGHHYRSEWWSPLKTEIQESPPFQCKSVADLERLP